MARHIVINPDVATDTKYDKAFLDVSGEPASTVTFTVHAPPAAPRTASSAMNAKHFATSPELFELSGKKTALIIAETANPAVSSVAVLRQEAGSSRDAASIPSSNRTLGIDFNLPIRSSGGCLFVGNPNTASAQVTTRYGNSASPVTDTVQVSPFGVAKINITQSSTNLLIRVTNGVQVVVKAVRDKEIVVVFPIGPAV